MIKLACNSLIAVSKDSKDCMDVEEFLDLSYESVSYTHLRAHET